MHISHPARATLVVALLGALRATPASSQVVDSARTARLPEIVVTATKVPFNAVTSAATILDGAALRRQGITNLADALRTVPGLAIVRTSSPGTRTSLYTRGGESGYTRVLVDGVPVNDPGGEFDYAHLTTDNIERIEIIRGPSSVLYGTDAVSGVIQVFTRDGARSPGVSVEARAGSFASRGVGATLAGAGGSTAYSIGIGRTETDGIHAFNSAYARTSFSSRLHVGTPGRGDAGLSMHYSDATTHVPTDGAGKLVDRNAFQFGERLTIGLDAGRPVSSRVELRLVLAAHNTDGGFDDAPDGPADTLGFFSSNGLDHVSRRSIDLRANASLSPAWLLTGGALLEEQRQRGFTTYGSEWGPSRSEVDVERSTRAGYAQLLGTTGGARWNLSARVDDSDAFGTFVTWRAGVALDATRTLRLRAVAGRAFREPTFFQNFAQGFVLGNPDLRPEQSQSWEVGADQRIGSRVRIGATWFHRPDRVFVLRHARHPELLQRRRREGTGTRTGGLGNDEPRVRDRGRLHPSRR
jgi:vitamin B12 transporter